MEQISGTYEGEGSNVAASNAIAPVPDVSTPSTATNKGQGRTAAVAVTRRRQLRVSSESARASLALNIGGGDQVLAQAARGFYCSGAGNIVGRLIEDTVDQTFSGLSAGTVYPFAFAVIRATGTTATGQLLF